MIAAVGAFFSVLDADLFHQDTRQTLPAALLLPLGEVVIEPTANVETRGGTSSRCNRCARRRGSRRASVGDCLWADAPAWRRAAATVRSISIRSRCACLDRVLVWPSQAFHIMFHIRTSTFSIHPRLFSQLLSLSTRPEDGDADMARGHGRDGEPRQGIHANALQARDEQQGV